MKRCEMLFSNILNDDDIIAEITHSNDNETGDEAEDIDDVTPPPSNSQACRFYHDSVVGEQMHSHMNSFAGMYDVSSMKGKRQSSIKDFFEKGMMYNLMLYC